VPDLDVWKLVYRNNVDELLEAKVDLQQTVVLLGLVCVTPVCTYGKELRVHNLSCRRVPVFHL
jgi:hypothetical protein